MTTEGPTYSVKDFLAIHTKALERIEAKVDTAAVEHAKALGALDTRVALLEAKPDLEPRVRQLEDSGSGSRAERDLKRWVLPLLVTAAAALSNFFHVHFS